MEIITQSIGDRLKEQEKKYEVTISSDKHLIIRLDGNRFSKFTKGFKKPYDKILMKVMEKTTKDLLLRFHCYTTYTQSDEITLFIPSLSILRKSDKQDLVHPYNGRVQKLTSLIAAYGTLRFNKYLRKYKNRRNGLIKDKLDIATFDARVYGVTGAVEDSTDVVNSFLWRIRDAEKNAKNSFAQYHCSHKELHKLTSDEQVDYTESKHNVLFKDTSSKFRHGIIAKRYIKQESGFDRQLKQVVTVGRTRVTTFPAMFSTFKELEAVVLPKFMEGN